jgi:hypothetical protein
MKLDTITVGLKAGPVSVEGSWKPNEEEQKAAWELYVELVTRISVMKLSPSEGMLREALTSLHSIFTATRTILRGYGPSVAQPRKDSDLSFGYLAVVVLNYVLRPCLTKWHPRLLNYEENKSPDVARVEHENGWESNRELREEIERVRIILIEYAALLATVAGVPTLVQEPNLPTKSPTDKMILNGDNLPYEP